MSDNMQVDRTSLPAEELEQLYAQVPMDEAQKDLFGKYCPASPICMVSRLWNGPRICYDPEHPDAKITPEQFRAYGLVACHER